MNKKRLLAVLGTGLAAAIALSAAPAQADPSGTPTYRDLAGVGSDTTQDVMNGMSGVVKDASGKLLVGSYDAFGSATITTKDPAVNTKCAINRPAGSGNGVTALVNSLAAADGCLQFARSSSNNSANYAGKSLTYIPFGVDAVTYAVRADSSVSRKLTKANLVNIYNCSYGTTYRPMLPQYGSGTRQFFLKQLGFTDAADFVTQPNHTCIEQVDSTGAPLQENNGLLLTDPKQVAPYSIAQYQSQTAGTVSDIHGKTVLGQLDAIPATVLNTSSSFVRDVYNVIPTSGETDPTYQSVFVGSTSQVCASADVIKKYGFAPHANCGATTLHTP